MISWDAQQVLLNIPGDKFFQGMTDQQMADVCKEAECSVEDAQKWIAAHVFMRVIALHGSDEEHALCIAYQQSNMQSYGDVMDCARDAWFDTYG